MSGGSDVFPRRSFSSFTASRLPSTFWGQLLPPRFVISSSSATGSSHAGVEAHNNAKANAKCRFCHMRHREGTQCRRYCELCIVHHQAVKHLHELTGVLGFPGSAFGVFGLFSLFCSSSHWVCLVCFVCLATLRVRGDHLLPCPMALASSMALARSTALASSARRPLQILRRQLAELRVRGGGDV